jgi:hypothetical protein
MTVENNKYYYCDMYLYISVDFIVSSFIIFG